MGLVVVGEAAVVVALVSSVISEVGEKGIESRPSSLLRGEEGRGTEENDDDDDDFADGKDYKADDDYVLVSRRCC